VSLEQQFYLWIKILYNMNKKVRLRWWIILTLCP